MTYRRYSRRRPKAAKQVQHEDRHSHSDSYFMPNVDDFARGMTPAIRQELNLSRDDWRDGVQSRWKVTEPIVTVKNYTHEVPLNSQRICKTCKESNDPINLRNGLYRCWCRLAFARGVSGWKQEPQELRDNNCRDWMPKTPDFIG